MSDSIESVVSKELDARARSTNLALSLLLAVVAAFITFALSRNIIASGIAALVGFFLLELILLAVILGIALILFLSYTSHKLDQSAIMPEPIAVESKLKNQPDSIPKRRERYDFGDLQKQLLGEKNCGQLVGRDWASEEMIASLLKDQSLSKSTRSACREVLSMQGYATRWAIQRIDSQ